MGYLKNIFITWVCELFFYCNHGLKGYSLRLLVICWRIQHNLSVKTIIKD